MIQEIHKKSLEISLQEKLTKINSMVNKVLVLSLLCNIILAVFGFMIKSKICLLICVPLSTYSLYYYIKFYDLWITKNKIQKQLNEKNN